VRNTPECSCDILASDRGPSCTKLEQIKGRNVYFIRFLQPKLAKVDGDYQAPNLPNPDKLISAPPMDHNRANVQAAKSTVFPKSVSISELLKAGKLVKPEKITVLELESFDVKNRKWNREGSIKLEIEGNKFSSGAFRVWGPVLVKIMLLIFSNQN